MELELYNSLVEKLKKSANDGNVEAMVDLADLCFQGPNMNDENMKAAIKYYMMAADCGNAYALAKSSFVLTFGMYGVEKNIDKGLHYMKKAAEADVVEVQYKLGECYEFGDFVEKDLQQAKAYYKMAADNGYVDAQYRLSGVKAMLDEDDWFNWLCIAHVCGSEEATSDLNAIIDKHGKEAYDTIQEEIQRIKEFVNNSKKEDA